MTYSCYAIIVFLRFYAPDLVEEGLVVLSFRCKAATVAAVFGLTALAAGASQAHIVNWTVSNGTFSDGGTFSGTFTINTATDTMVTWDLQTSVVTGGAGDGAGYIGADFAPVGAESAGDNGGSPSFGFGDFIYLGDAFYLTNIPFDGSGTVSVLTGSETSFCTYDGICNYNVSRTITGGEAVGVIAVPEPSTWAMMILGLGGLGAALRVRRKSAMATA